MNRRRARVLVAAHLLLLVACGDDPAVSTNASDSPSPSASVSATLSPPRGGPLAESEFLAVLGDGRVVAMRADTGSVSREISRLAIPANPTVTAALTPDRSAVYVEVSAGVCPARLHHVDIATGTASPAGDGREPSVSPDGKQLAYLGRRCGQPETARARSGHCEGPRRRAPRADQAADVQPAASRHGAAVCR